MPQNNEIHQENNRLIKAFSSLFYSCNFSSFDGNSLKDIRWRVDGETGHPVFNQRYAFRDKLNAPYHVVDSRADGRGRTSKTYTLKSGEIEKLLNERVSVPELLDSRGKKRTTATPDATKPMKANRKTSMGGHRHRVKTPANSTMNEIVPSRATVRPSNAPGATTTRPSTIKHPDRTPTPTTPSPTTPTPSFSTNKSHKHRTTMPSTKKDVQKPNPINTNRKEQLDPLVNTTTMSSADVRPSQSPKVATDLVKMTNSTQIINNNDINDGVIIATTTAATPSTPTRAEQHSPRATSQTVMPTNIDNDIADPIDAANSDDDDDIVYDVEVEDLSEPNPNEPHDTVPTIDPIIYEGILGAVNSDYFPSFQPEFSVDPKTGQPVFTNQYAFRDNVNPSYYVYDAKTNKYKQGDYFKNAVNEQKVEKSPAADRKNATVVDKPTKRPNTKFSFNKPRPMRPNAPHVAQPPTRPPVIITTEPPHVQPPIQQPNEANVHHHQHHYRPDNNNNNQNIPQQPPPIDPNVYQGIVGASQFGFPSYQPLFVPNQQQPSQQTQYGVWTFHGFGYQTPGQLAFQQNFYFPPAYAPQYGPPPPPNAAITAPHPTSEPFQYHHNHFHGASVPYDTSSSYETPVYTSYPGSYPTSKSPTETTHALTTRRHTKPSGNEYRPPPQTETYPSTQYPQYPVSTYEPSHKPHRPSYSTQTEHAYTERPNYFTTSPAPSTTERPNYFTTSSKPLNLQYQHHHPSYLTSTASSYPTYSPPTTIGTTERPNYFTTSKKPSGGHHNHHHYHHNTNRPYYSGTAPTYPTYSTSPATTIHTTERPNYFTPSTRPTQPPSPPPAIYNPVYPSYQPAPNASSVHHPIYIAGSPPNGNQVTIAYGPNVFNHHHHPSGLQPHQPSPPPTPTVYSSAFTTTTTTTTAQNSAYGSRTPTQYPTYYRDPDYSYDIRNFNSPRKGNLVTNISKY